MNQHNTHPRHGEVGESRPRSAVRLTSDSVARLAFSAVSIGLGVLFLGRSLMVPCSALGLVGSGVLLELGLYPVCRMGVEILKREGLPNGGS